MRTTVLLLALAIAGTWGALAQESPGLTLYRQLGLPLPPLNAELVVLKNSNISYGDATGTYEPKAVAWRIRTPKGNVYMAGPATLTSDNKDRSEYKQWEDAAPVSEAEALNSRMVVCSLRHPFEADTTFGLALQAEALGLDELSKKMLSSKSMFSWSRELGEDPTPESRVWLMAFKVTLGAFLEEGFDRKALTARLGSIAQHLPKNEFGMVGWSLRSLEAALRPSTAKPGSTEWLIDQWVNARNGNTTHGLDTDLLDPILARGLQAVPQLIAHREDERATLLFSPRFMNAAPSFQTIGRTCSEVLAQLMSGRFVNRGALYNDQKPDEWWEATRTLNEREVLESVVFPGPEEAKKMAGGFFDTLPANPVALRMLVLRHPEALPGLYKRCLTLSGVSSQDVAQALLETPLSVAQKTALFEEGANSKTAEHRGTAIHMLKQLNTKPLGPLLVKALSAEPPFGDGNYWSSPARNLAGQVISSGSAEAFAALASAMKRSELGYRVEAMSAFRYSWADRLSVATKKLAFDLLEIFEDDAELYDPLQHGFEARSFEESARDKWEGPGVLDEFKTSLAARDFAYVCIAAMLHDEVERSPSLSLEQWAQFRARIRKKLAEWRVQHGGVDVPNFSMAAVR